MAEMPHALKIDWNKYFYKEYTVTNFWYEYYYVDAVLFPIYGNFGRDFLKMTSLTPVFVPQIGSLGTGIYQMFHKYKLLLPLSDVA